MSHHLCSWVTDHNLIGYQCPLCLFLSSHRLLESKFNWISGSRLSCHASSLSSGNRPLNTSLHQLQWWESHFNWSSVSCQSLLSSFYGRYFLGYEHKGYIYVQAHVCLQSDTNQNFSWKCRNMVHWTLHRRMHCSGESPSLIGPLCSFYGRISHQLAVNSHHAYPAPSVR